MNNINIKPNGLPQLVTRLALGAGFLLPVADRMGILGPNGTTGVAWGDWQHFETYAHTLMPFLSDGLNRISATVATFLEVIFGLCLIIGFKTQLTAICGAILTCTFGICMLFTQGIAAPFNYPVFVFVGACLLLASIETPKWSIDAIC